MGGNPATEEGVGATCWVPLLAVSCQHICAHMWCVAHVTHMSAHVGGPRHTYGRACAWPILHMSAYVRVAYHGREERMRKGGDTVERQGGGYEKGRRHSGERGLCQPA